MVLVVSFLTITTITTTSSCSNNRSLLFDNNQEVLNKKVWQDFLDSSVHLEIEKKDLPTQIFFDLPIKKIHGNSLILHEVISVVGQASDFDEYIKLDQENNDDFDVNLFSNIIATPLINDAGLNVPKMYNQKTSLDNHKMFELSLLKDFSYLIALNPYGKYDKAPIYFYASNLKADSSFKFVNDKNSKNLTSKIIGYDLNILHEQETKVFLYQGSHLISSIAQINADGSFNLELSNQLSFANLPIYLHIIIQSKDGSYSNHLSYKIPSKLSDFNLDSIDLGSLKKTFDLQINLLSQNKSSVGEALIILKTTINNVDLFITLKTNSDSQANIPKIYEGIYDVDIVTSSNSTFSSLTAKAQEIKQTKELNFVLKSRLNFNGVILDEKNNPLANAQVELTRTDNNELSGLSAFKINAITNEKGLIYSNGTLLSLDEGHYLAHIKPPFGDGFGSTYYNFEFPKNNNLQIKLPKAIELKSQIVLSDKTPLAHAFVTIYSRDKVLATCMTDDQGRFIVPLVVP